MPTIRRHLRRRRAIWRKWWVEASLKGRESLHRVPIDVEGARWRDAGGMDVGVRFIVSARSFDPSSSLM